MKNFWQSVLNFFSGRPKDEKLPHEQLSPKEIVEQVTHSNADGETITPSEVRFIKNGLKTHGPTCPDCQKGTFIMGPEGGCSVNVMCNHCFAEFCVLLFEDAICMSTRIAPRGTVREERKMFYGFHSEVTS